MNYCEIHLGDLEKATAHLTGVEDGMYWRLMRRYYDTEQPLPIEVKQIKRLVRARSRDELDAVETVLAEFFSLEDDGWHQKRCDEEIAAYQAKQADAGAKRENEAERQRRHRERRKVLFDELRGHGIVPKFDTTTSELEAILSRVTTGASHADGHAPVTPLITANQTPDTRHQTKALNPPPSSQAPKTHNPTEAGRACLLMRQAGCGQANPSHADLVAALAEGVTPEALGDTAREAVEAGKAKPFAWAISTARSRHAEGPKPLHLGNGRIEPSQPTRNPEGPSPRLDPETERIRLAETLAEQRRQYPEMFDAQ